MRERNQVEIQLRWWAIGRAARNVALTVLVLLVIAGTAVLLGYYIRVTQ